MLDIDQHNFKSGSRPRFCFGLLSILAKSEPIRQVLRTYCIKKKNMLYSLYAYNTTKTIRIIKKGELGQI